MLGGIAVGTLADIKINHVNGSIALVVGVALVLAVIVYEFFKALRS